ncbi:hypothetical protein OSSY52_01320 [Tepiditoga spiralis]|uniref:Uncharacterized protein n=1 Tax=Tepiditoga spiralis TaxID=2108365 RepID=A0A7G1G170_9BACT|nr:hypothetical protein [Tepiditoga spiralis]BBE29991.1 hypothetical protein OSSY52_01320 [Tepiditoga spiralis]
MYKKTLETLYKFLGKELLKNENRKKLEESIFNNLKTVLDFKEIYSSIKELENFEVQNYLLEMLMSSFFNKLNMVYKDKELMYGEKKISIELTSKALEFLIEIAELSEPNTELIFNILSNDIELRAEAIASIFSNSKNLWEEDEINSYLKKLKPLTLKFLIFLCEVELTTTEELLKKLNLKNKKSVSALVSALSRNAPKGKEKLVFKNNNSIKINMKYKNIIMNELKKRV